MEVNCDPHTIPNSEAEGSVSISEDQLTLPVYHVRTAVSPHMTGRWSEVIFMSTAHVVNTEIPRISMQILYGLPPLLV